MMERGFLEVKTFKDIISARGSKQKLITVEKNQLVSQAVELMRKYEIEHIPVMEGTDVIGAISENGLFQKMFSDPNLKNEKIENILEKPYAIIDFHTPVEKIRNMINRESGAVLAKDESGALQIVTKYDIIQSLT